MTSTTARMQWSDPLTDPALSQTLATAVADARRDLPDVLASAGRVPAVFTRVCTLFLERVRYLQVDAINVAAADVEFVVSNATLLSAGLGHQGATAIPDLQASANSRAAARNLTTAREVLQAKERVVTRSASHTANVDAALLAGNDALAELDRIIKSEHRFGHLLTYATPDPLQMPLDCLEIGLARVLEALPKLTDTNDTERGAA